MLKIMWKIPLIYRTIDIKYEQTAFTFVVVNSMPDEYVFHFFIKNK